MKAFAFTHNGFGDICAQELKEKGAEVLETADEYVIFSAPLPTMVSLLYTCQAPIQYILEGVSLEFTGLENMHELASQFDFPLWAFDTFCVRGSSDSLPRRDIEGCLGEIIQKRTKKKVNLSQPGITFFAYVSGRKAFFGVDPFSFDISKRDYKIFHSQNTLKGTMAYCFLRWGGYHGKGMLLDPCCGSGVIPIEAALLATQRSPLYFRKKEIRFSSFTPFASCDEEKIYHEVDRKINAPALPIYAFDALLPQVKAAQKNAKIAGVDKTMTITKVDIEWLDIKFQEGEVSCLVTQPPLFAHAEKEEKRFYDMLFHQAAYITGKKGVVALLTKKQAAHEEAARQYQFALAEQRMVFGGKQEFCCTRYQKE